MLSIVWFWASALIIMGEGTFFRFTFVDTIYSNIGTNPIDVWSITFWTVEFIILIAGSFWAMGLFHYIGEWFENQ